MNPRLLRPTASGFNPKSISGLDLWLDANDSATITTVSSAVSQWTDKTASKAFAQTVANNRPLLNTVNGKTAVLFDASNDFLTATDAFTTFPFSFFVAKRITSHTNFGMTYTVSDQNDFKVRQLGTSGRIQIQQPSTAATSADSADEKLPTDAPLVLSIVYEATAANSKFYLNGRQLNVATGGFAQPTIVGTHYIGSRNGIFPIAGSICEILVYGKTVSALERAKITSYLGKKWGAPV
jgi:hypothetical protein